MSQQMLQAAEEKRQRQLAPAGQAKVSPATATGGAAPEAAGGAGDQGDQGDEAYPAPSEGGGQPAVTSQLQHMMNAQFSGYLRGAVGAAVIDHEILDCFEAGDFARQIADHGRERCFFIKAGDLDDEFHWRCVLQPVAAVKCGKVGESASADGRKVET
jgi:hypothetical protein